MNANNLAVQCVHHDWTQSHRCLHFDDKLEQLTSAGTAGDNVTAPLRHAWPAGAFG